MRKSTPVHTQNAIGYSTVNISNHVDIPFKRQNSSFPLFEQSLSAHPLTWMIFEVEEFFQEVKGVQCTNEVSRKEQSHCAGLLNIASITSSHGTDEFRSYLHAMKKIEDMARAGENLN